MTSPRASGSQEPEDTPRIPPATEDQAEALVDEQPNEKPFSSPVDAVAYFSDPKLRVRVKDSPQG